MRMIFFSYEHFRTFLYTLNFSGITDLSQIRFFLKMYHFGKLHHQLYCHFKIWHIQHISLVFLFYEDELVIFINNPLLPNW